MLEEQKKLLLELDNFEEEIELIDKLKKQYDDIKGKLKKSMIEAGNEIGAEQVKWITPKGTKITCSIGHPAEFEKKKKKVFDVKILMDKYPEIYEECKVEVEESVMVKNATSDTLRITLSSNSKGGE